MKLIKRLSGLFAAAAAVSVICFCACGVSAQEISDNTEQVMTQDIVDPVTEDDAGYYKFISQQESAEQYAEGLTHQSRFANIPKINGIDVSYYQGNINWSAVKASGIKFVIIRAGYRGYGYSGDLVEDPNFKTYLAGAKAAGLKVGLYFYTQAINTTEAAAEAQFVLDRLGGQALQMPIYYDIESVDYASGRLDTAGLSVSQKTALCKAFCDKIKSAGYRSGVYANYYWLTNMIDGASLAKSYPIWVAQYSSQTWWTGPMEMWQYSGSGIVSGISNYTDMNVWYYQGDEQVSMKISGSVTGAETGRLTWSKPSSSAARYDVYRVNTDGTETKVKSVTTLYADFALNLYNVNYYVKVYNSSGTQIGASSNKVKLQGGVISSMAVSGKTMNTVSLKWSSISCATGYVLYAKKADGSEGYTRRGYVYTNSGRISSLEPCVKYTFCVRPFYNPAGTKTWTDSCQLGPVSASVSDLPEYSKITNLKVVSTTTDSITVKWSSVPLATAYRVYIKRNETGAAYVGQANITDTTYTFTGLTPYNEYKMVVRPFYGSDLGQLSNEPVGMPLAMYKVDLLSNKAADKALSAKVTIKTTSGTAVSTLYTSDGYFTIPSDPTLKSGGLFLVYVEADGFVKRTYLLTFSNNNISSGFTAELAKAGDANLDGAVDTADILLIKYNLKRGISFTGYQALTADASGDGAVNTADITAIKAKLKGLA